jgi:hypothetical protein
MRSIPTLIRLTSRDAATRHGVFGGAGGLSPDCLIDLVSVDVAVPPGVEILDWDVSLVSSEQPEIPIPKPVNTTPIIVALISFRMKFASDLGNAAASDLA